MIALFSSFVTLCRVHLASRIVFVSAIVCACACFGEDNDETGPTRQLRVEPLKQNQIFADWSISAVTYVSESNRIAVGAYSSTLLPNGQIVLRSQVGLVSPEKMVLDKVLWNGEQIVTSLASNGSQLIAAVERAEGFVWDVRRGETIRQLHPAAQALSSADGRHLILRCRNRLRFGRMNGELTEDDLGTKINVDRGCVWMDMHPTDRESVLIVCANDEVRSFNFTSGEVGPALGCYAGIANAECLAIGRSKLLVAWADSDGSIWCVRPGTAAEPSEVARLTRVASMAFSGDDQILAVAHSNQNVSFLASDMRNVSVNLSLSKISPEVALTYSSGLKCFLAGTFFGTLEMFHVD